jgi:ADP-ribosylglycohydrolase/fructose-1,6-bisphosphatase/inositol monophosphatase family enzyme
MSELKQALSLAIETARTAGAMLREEFHLPGGPRGSGDHAEIDEPVERFIRERILSAFPWRYHGEETGRSGDDASCSYLWLVDPNDGTADFLKGHRGSAVSIGLLHETTPVLGVVYAFGYPDDEGDLIAWAEGCPLTRNGVEVRRDVQPVVFVSAKADRNPEANLACTEPYRYITRPSVAYRLAVVAAGDGVAGVSLGGAGAWDYGAGHALLRGAGCLLLNEEGQEVAYTRDGLSSSWGCFGGEPDVVRQFCQRDWKSVFSPHSAPKSPFCLTQPQRGRTLRDAGVLARAQGCLLGQFAGDALGSLVEFKKPAVIRAAYPSGIHDLSDGGTWNNLPGQPTDDSELALMLARTLLHHAKYDRGVVLDAYLHWWPRAWDRGNTIRAALGSASHGKTSADRLQLVETNANRSSQANGSLMRISPLGIFGAGRPTKAAEWARVDSGLTHPNKVCKDACAVFVAAIAHAIATACSPAECHAAGLAEADRSKVEPSVRQALEDARIWRPQDYVTNMGWVLIALQNAFYQLLHAETLEEGVVDTVMQGGDTDTTGAICGALLGAVHGRKAIPPRWLQVLLSCRPLPDSGTAHPQPPEFWPVDALELAEALLVIGSRTR